MNIAIVDDDKSQRLEIKGLLYAYFQDNRLCSRADLSITEYSNGEEFLLDFCQDKFQLILLDIYMKDLNGIEVAARLRRIDKRCGIILITSSSDHMLDGYDVRAIGYVLKPLSENKISLFRALNNAIDSLNLDTAGIDVQTKSGTSLIWCKNIIYFDCAVRNLHLHLPKEILTLTGKYDDYKQLLLADPRFLECYRNTIVNMDYIESRELNDFLLTNGERIPISRRRKNDVLELYTDYFIKSRCI